MKRTLRFGVEYLASPVFNASLDQMGHEDLEDLGLSDSLVSQIRAWDRIFQDTFCDEYPPDSGFKTPAEIRLHNEEGLRLYQALLEELSSRYVVEFIPLKFD